MYTLMALIIVLLTFCMAVLAYAVCVNKRMSDDEKKNMLLSCACSTATAYANLFSTMIINGVAGGSLVLLGLLKASEHSFGPLSFVFSSRLVKKDKAGKYLTWLFYLNTVIQFASIWTGWAFTVDADLVYREASLNAFTVICSLLGSLYLYYAFYSFSKAYRNKNVFILLMIAVMLSVGVAAHVVVSQFKVSFIASMLSLILTYIYLDDFNKQVQDEEIAREMHILDTLTLTYECVYEVDLATRCFQALRVSERIGKQLGGRFTPDTKYETGMEAYCRLNVYAEDQGPFMENTKLEVIAEALKDSKSYTFGYRVFRDDRIQFFNMSAYKMLEDGKLTHILVAFADVDEAKRRWETLLKVSTTDQMTGAYNRRAYNEEAERIDRLPLAEKCLTEAVMVDLNGLKQANDTYGHEAGDELITCAAGILQRVYGEAGNVYRIGGDEFVVIANIKKEDSGAYVRKLRDAIAQWKGTHIDAMAASVGTARIDESGKDVSVEEVVRVADARMYEDKEAYYRLRGGRK